jgi:hypothetical protein
MTKGRKGKRGEGRKGGKERSGRKGGEGSEPQWLYNTTIVVRCLNVVAAQSVNDPIVRGIVKIFWCLVPGCQACPS